MHLFAVCRCGISPKKLLLPMSFATVLGGTATLIGTSTNLVVSGLQEKKYGTTDPSKVFQFFTITPYGVPYAVWGKWSHSIACVQRKPCMAVDILMGVFCNRALPLTC